MTSTRQPGRSGLGNAYTSVMSAIGSARARGPEMWSDMAAFAPGGRSVPGLVRGWLQGWGLQDLGGLRMVQHLLEGGGHPLGLPDLLDRARVVPRIRRCRLLGTKHERSYGGQIREAVVPLHVPEDHIEEGQGWPGGEEVLHVGIPRPVEAGHERQPGVVVQKHEPGLVDRPYRHPVVTRAVAVSVLEILQSGPQRRPRARLDLEEQAELAGRSDTPARLDYVDIRCDHRPPPHSLGLPW